MEQSSKYPNQRPAGKEHIPLYPRGFITVRILQLIIGLVCLGLSGFGIAYLVFAGDCLTLFTSIVTLISSIYCLVARFGPPNAYNYWAILGLDIFLLIFWLVSFAVLAAQVAPSLAYYASYSDYLDDYYSYYGVDSDTYDAAFMTYLGALAGAAGLGGIEFILYIVSLSIHGVRLSRHRKAGLHAMPLVSSSPSGPGGEKIQMQPQPLQPQTQQPYPQPAHIYPNQGNFPQQNMYAAAPQQQQHNMYPQQQPQQVIASPISSQPTGSSYTQGPPVSLNPNNQPVYEAHGDNIQK